jgi:hypothetical protein
MALINSGSTYQQAADAVGVTRSTVAGVVYRHRRDIDEFVDSVMAKCSEPIFIKVSKQPRRGLVGRITDWVMART